MLLIARICRREKNFRDKGFLCLYPSIIPSIVGGERHLSPPPLISLRCYISCRHRSLPRSPHSPQQGLVSVPRVLLERVGLFRRTKG